MPDPQKRDDHLQFLCTYTSIHQRIYTTLSMDFDNDGDLFIENNFFQINVNLMN